MTGLLTFQFDGMDEVRRDLREARRIVADEGIRLGVFDGITEGIAEAKAKHTHTTRTGALERGLRARLLSRGADFCEGEMVSEVPYSSYVENGTRPHIIRPKEGHGFQGPLKEGQTRRAKNDVGTYRIALRFESGGQIFFRRLVNLKKGTKAYPFMGLAYLKCERVMQARIAAAVAKAQRLFEVS